MKEIILKYLENKKIKYEKLYCKHNWILKESWDTTDTRTGVKRDSAIILFICEKCGKFKEHRIF